MNYIRKFSELEKQFIKIIIDNEYQTNKVSSILISYLDSETKLIIDKSSILLHSKSTFPNCTSDELKALELKTKTIFPIIYQLINLLNYLEKRGLLIVYNISKEKNFYVLGEEKNFTSITKELPNMDISNKLYYFFEKEIIPSPELFNLYRDKFLSIEEKRFKTQKNLTIISIIISFIIGISATVNQIQDKISLKPSQKIQQEQIKQLSSDIHEINQSIRKIINKHIDSKSK